MLFVGILRRRDVADGESVLLRGRYALAGVSVGANPAYLQGEVYGEWVPVAPLQLRAQYDAFGFFGTNGALLRFPSAGAQFGTPQIQALSGTDRAGIGHRVMFTPVLRARLGPVVLRNETNLAWYRPSPHSGWYYEWEYDTLLASSDFLVSDRLAALAVLWRSRQDAALLAGPAYELTHAFKANLTRQRLEGILFWSPFARFGFVVRPRFLAIVGVNLEDRNRAGEPFALVGVGGDADL